MRLAVILLVAACLTACAMKPQGAVQAKVAIEKACSVAVPDKPVFPADNLTGNEDIWTLGMTLWADRKERMAYELKVEIALRGCTNPLGGI